MENSGFVTYHLNPQQQPAFVVINPSVIRPDMITSQLTITEDMTTAKKTGRGRKSQAATAQHIANLTAGTIIAKEIPTTSRQTRVVATRGSKSQPQPSVIAIANNPQIVSQVVAAGPPGTANATVVSEPVAAQNISTITIVKTAEERVFSLVRISKTLCRLGTILLNKLLEVAAMEQHSRNPDSSGVQSIFQVDNVCEVRNLPELFTNDPTMVELQLLIDYLRQLKNGTGEDLTYDNEEPYLIPANTAQNPKAVYRCPHDGCMYSCMRSNALDKHISAVHLMLKNFKCNYCQQSFSSNAQLDRHLRQSHSDLLQQTYYTCDYQNCTSMFKNITNKKIHMRSVHEARAEFACDWPNCEFIGKNRSQIDCHERKHTGMKPFMCSNSQCDKSFRTRDSMRRHELTHTMERRFVCNWPGCGMKFKIGRTLREHQARHSGLNQVKCTINGCNFETNYRHKLQSHEAEVHGKPKPFQCTWNGCGKGFFNKQKFMIHSRIHSNERIFPCIHQGCDKSFVEKGNMMKHYKNVHVAKGTEQATTTTVVVAAQPGSGAGNIVNLGSGGIVNTEIVPADPGQTNMPTVTVANASTIAAFNSVGGVSNATPTIAVVPAGAQFIHHS